MHVSDNASPDERYLQLPTMFKDVPYVCFSRNHHNLGIVGNILKGFTLIKEGYLWVLSDDDEINPEKIPDILKAITEQPSHIYLRSSIEGEVNLKKDLYLDKSDILRTFSSASMTGLISANIYNLSVCSKYVEAGYRYGNTLFPHSAIFYSALVNSEAFTIRILNGLVKWNYGEITYTEIHDISWTHYLELTPIFPGNLKTIFIKKFLSDWRRTHLFNIFLRSKQLSRYWFYAFTHPTNFIDFIQAFLIGFFQKLIWVSNIGRVKRFAKKIILKKI